MRGMGLSKSSVAYGAGILSISGIFLSLLRFLYRVMLSRILRGEGMGVYQLIFPLYSLIMSITLSGLSTAVSNGCARMNALGDKCGQGRLLSLSFRVFLVLFSAAAAISLSFRGFIAETLLGDARTGASLTAIIVCILFTGFENLYKAYFRGVGDIGVTVVSENFEQLVRMGAVLALDAALRPKSVGGAVALVAWGMVISEMASSGFLWAVFRRRRLLSFCGLKREKGGLKKLFEIAAPVSAASILSSAIYSVNTVLVPRRLIAGGMTAGGALSAFGIITGMVMPLFMLPTSLIHALAAVLTPKIVAGAALGRVGDVRRKAAKALRVTSLLAFSASGILLPLSPALCAAIFKINVPPAYLAASAIAAAAEHFEIMAVALLVAFGLQKNTPILTAVCGGAEILIIYWAAAIPGLGIYAIIAAAFFRSALTALLSAGIVLRKTKLKPDFLAWVLIPALVFIITGFITNSVFLRIGGGGGAPAIAFAAGVGALAAVLSGIVLGIRPLRYFKTLITPRTGAAKRY